MSYLIPDVSPREHYTATAGQTLFTVPFRFGSGELKVYVNGTLMTYSATPADATQYSTTGQDEEEGGSITFGAGLTLSDEVAIIRDIPVERTSDFPAIGRFPIEDLNRELFRLTAMVQQIEMKLDQRVLRLSVFDLPETLNDIPGKAERANNFLAFDADGQPAMLSTQSGGLASTVFGRTLLLLNDLAELLALLDLNFATAADVRASAAGGKIVTADLIEGASAFVALTDEASIAFDWDAGLCRSVTLGGNRTIGNPTNGQPGTWRTVLITQDGTGGRTLSFGDQYRFTQGVAPTLSTAAGALDALSIFCISPTDFMVYFALNMLVP